MNVKNNSSVPIPIGHTTIAPGASADIDETLLYQPRVQALRANGDLLFPFNIEAAHAARAELRKPERVERPPAKLGTTRAVLEIATEVKSPETVLTVTPKAAVDEPNAEEKPKGKRK